MSNRNSLELDDPHLLDQCDVHVYKSSGPGGQHRNKVSSAVRLVHRPTGLTVHADDNRSQHQNKRLALRRLRLQIACMIRCPVDRLRPDPPAALKAFLPASSIDQQTAGRIRINTKNESFYPIAAYLLDVLMAFEGKLSDSASYVGISTSNLARVLMSDRHVLSAAQNIRKAFNLPPIK